MFRTHHNRGRKRFLRLRQGRLKKDAVLPLNQHQVKIIENTQLLSLGEKIELLLTSVGIKLTTEIYTSIKYEFSPKKKAEVASEASVNQLRDLFKQLPFYFFLDQKELVEKDLNKRRIWQWFQVSVNESVNHFLQHFGDELTEYEEGILYGYPLSAIRAFGGLIEVESSKEPLTVFEYYLAGVGSKMFRKEECNYYKSIWERLKKLSPTLIAEAEKAFERKKYCNSYSL